MNYRMAFLVSLAFLVSCASKPEPPAAMERYPDFYKSGVGEASVDVIIDSIVLSDLKGSALGYNKYKNTEIQEIAYDEVVGQLKHRRFEVNLLNESNGLYFETENDIQYVYSEEFKSLGVTYGGPDFSDINNPWNSEAAIGFIQNLKRKARTKNKELLESANTEDFISNLYRVDYVPDFVINSPADRLVFVCVYSKDVSASKSLVAILANSVLNFGLGLESVDFLKRTNSSYLTVEIIVLNKKQKTIEWYDGYGSRGGDYRAMSDLIRHSFIHYPHYIGGYN